MAPAHARSPGRTPLGAPQHPAVTVMLGPPVRHTPPAAARHAHQGSIRCAPCGAAARSSVRTLSARRAQPSTRQTACARCQDGYWQVWSVFAGCVPTLWGSRLRVSTRVFVCLRDAASARSRRRILRVRGLAHRVSLGVRVGDSEGGPCAPCAREETSDCRALRRARHARSVRAATIAWPQHMQRKSRVLRGATDPLLAWLQR